MSYKKIEVNFRLPNKNQKILVGNGALNELPEYLIEKKYSKIIFFIDKKVQNIHFEYINNFFQKCSAEFKIVPLEITKDKSILSLNKILDQCIANNLDRKSCFVGIGGGRVGDLVGLAAAIYMRGVDFIQVGTTFMSQMDGVIGKVAIDYAERKNIIGSFSSPVLTICDTYFLKENPAYFMRAGLIEVAKHAFIKPKNFLNKFEKVIKNLKSQDFAYSPAIEDLVSSSMRIKAYFVKNDFLDINGQHTFLSYGHTIANAIEELSCYKIRHGEAVAIGMLVAAEYSKKIHLMNKQDYVKHNEIIKSIIDLKIPSGISFEKIYQILARDKASYRKTPRMLILKTFGIGKIINIDKNILRECIKFLK
jgi:3-dehydroquinate synthase